MKVLFRNVGYLAANFERECNGELTYKWLYKQVKSYCMSRNLDFSYDEDTRQGIIFGGMRVIGKFEVEK